MEIIYNADGTYTIYPQSFCNVSNVELLTVNIDKESCNISSDKSLCYFSKELSSDSDFFIESHLYLSDEKSGFGLAYITDDGETPDWQQYYYKGQWYTGIITKKDLGIITIPINLPLQTWITIQLHYKEGELTLTYNNETTNLGTINTTEPLYYANNTYHNNTTIQVGDEIKND